MGAAVAWRGNPGGATLPGSVIGLGPEVPWARGRLFHHCRILLRDFVHLRDCLIGPLIPAPTRQRLRNLRHRSRLIRRAEPCLNFCTAALNRPLVASLLWRSAGRDREAHLRPCPDRAPPFPPGPPPHLRSTATCPPENQFSMIPVMPAIFPEARADFVPSCSLPDLRHPCPASPLADFCRQRTGRQRSMFLHRRGGRRRRLRVPTQHCVNAHEQFLRHEGLVEIIVGAPRSRPITRSSPSARAVSIITGIVSPLARRLRSALRPSTPGIIRSSTMMDGRSRSSRRAR